MIVSILVKISHSWAWMRKGLWYTLERKGFRKSWQYNKIVETYLKSSSKYHICGCSVVFGGALIGFLHGLLVSLITVFTKHVRVVEPLIIFSTAYSAFLFAELFHWSGIISIIAFGIATKVVSNTLLIQLILEIVISILNWILRSTLSDFPF